MASFVNCIPSLVCSSEGIDPVTITKRTLTYALAHTTRSFKCKWMYLPAPLLELSLWGILTWSIKYVNRKHTTNWSSPIFCHLIVQIYLFVLYVAHWIQGRMCTHCWAPVKEICRACYMVAKTLYSNLLSKKEQSMALLKSYISLVI